MPDPHATPDRAANHAALLKATYRVLDRLYTEALNGAVCTPPDTTGEPFSEAQTIGLQCDVEGPLGRNYCASCRNIWREIMALRADCGRELGYKAFRR